MFWVIIRLLVEIRLSSFVSVSRLNGIPDRGGSWLMAGSSLFWSKSRLSPAMLGGRRAVVIIIQTFAIAFLDSQSLIW